MEAYNIISLIFEGLSCIGIIIAILEFKISRKSIFSTYEREKKLATMDVFKEYEDRFHSYNRIIYEKHKHNNMTYEQITEDEKFYKMICTYLNQLELICTGINIGIYDIDVLERLFGDVIVRIYRQTYPVIERYRKERQTDIVYAEFEKVAKEMMRIQEKINLNGKADIKYKPY